MRPDADGNLVAVAQPQPLPSPGPGDVLIHVAASALNRADLLQRDGDYNPPPGESDTPGLEVSGDVIEVGEDVSRFRIGDRVCALLGSGGHATHVLARQEHVLALDTHVDASDVVEAAALPEALCTAWWNLVELGRVRPGESVLIYGANSGVGHLAAQAARALGASVIGATRGTDWHPALEAMGIDCVDMDAPDPERRILERAPGGVDIVLDLVGAAYSTVTQSVLARQGRWLSIGLLGGEDVTLSLRGVIRNRWIITGSSLRSLSAAEKARAVEGVRSQLWPSVSAGTIRAHIDSVYDYSEVQAALERLELGRVFGKILITH